MEQGETRAKLTGDAYTELPGYLVTVNQIVAWNMAYFRKAAVLTQEELGDRLGWSAAVVSAAERSWDGKRIRQFTVDDVAGIAGALDIPITALFLPPEDDGLDVRYIVEVPGSYRKGTDGIIRWNMHRLMGYVLSDPDPYQPYEETDGSASDQYRTRYVETLNAYFGVDQAAEMLNHTQDLTTEDRVAEYLERVRAQRQALREIIADRDLTYEALAQRLRELRGNRSSQSSQANAPSDDPQAQEGLT